MILMDALVAVKPAQAASEMEEKGSNLGEEMDGTGRVLATMEGQLVYNDSQVFCISFKGGLGQYIICSIFPFSELLSIRLTPDPQQTIRSRSTKPLFPCSL